MTTMFDTTIRCPACDTSFQVRTVGSCGAAGQDTDFRPKYWGANPLPHFVHTCPNCLFSGTSGHFEGAVDDRLRAWLASEKALGTRAPKSASARFALAARCREQARDDALSVADLYLRGSWCARSEGDREVERRCQQATAEHLTAGLEANQVPQEELDTIRYLLGEIHRRLGDFDRAVTLLERVTEGQIGELAKRQLEFARAKNSDNTSI